MPEASTRESPLDQLRKLKIPAPLLRYETRTSAMPGWRSYNVACTVFSTPLTEVPDNVIRVAGPLTSAMLLRA